LQWTEVLGTCACRGRCNANVAISSGILGHVKLLSKKVQFSCLLQQNVMRRLVSEALYEADKALQKFAAVPRECACLQDGRRWIENICFILLFCV